MSEQERVLEYVRHAGAACPYCGYELRGLAVALCPECGRRIRMVHLLGPRRVDRRTRIAYMLVAAVLVAVNMYVVWELWHHAPAASVWEWLFVRSGFSWRRRTVGAGGLGLLPLLDMGLIIYALRLEEHVAAGLRAWHVLAVSGVLTAVYAVVGLLVF